MVDIYMANSSRLVRNANLIYDPDLIEAKLKRINRLGRWG